MMRNDPQNDDLQGEVRNDFPSEILPSEVVNDIPNEILPSEMVNDISNEMDLRKERLLGFIDKMKGYVTNPRSTIQPSLDHLLFKVPFEGPCINKTITLDGEFTITPNEITLDIGFDLHRDVQADELISLLEVIKKRNQHLRVGALEFDPNLNRVAARVAMKFREGELGFEEDCETMFKVELVSAIGLFEKYKELFGLIVDPHKGDQLGFEIDNTGRVVPTGIAEHEKLRIYNKIAQIQKVHMSPQQLSCG